MIGDAKRYYALLGLDPTCSDEAIRAAFRRRAKQLHPDVEFGDAAAFIRLKRAYDTLGDPAKRARYDRGNRLRSRRPVDAPGDRRPVDAPGDLPLPPRPRRQRRGGISLARYIAAFVFVGGLSLGAVEEMISDAGVPPSTYPRLIGLTRPPENKIEVSKGAVRARDPESVGAGFWDPANPTSKPREADESRRPGGIAASTAE